MKKTRKFICFALATIMICPTFSACKSTKNFTVTGAYDNLNAYENELKFYCSDPDMEFFLNDYYSRNIRNGDDAIGGLKMGAGSTYQKLWEADSLVWFDSTQNALQTYDAMNWLKAYLQNITIDKYGYIYSMADPINPYGETGPYQSMGWPFPSYKTDVGTGKDPIAYGANFKNANDVNKWIASGGTIEHDATYGAMKFSFSGSVDEELSLQTSTLDKNGRGYNTVLFGNFLEVEMTLEDLSGSGGLISTNVDDWFISWQTEENGNEWFTVSQKEWALNAHNPKGCDTFRANFPLYMHEKWDNKHITALKLTIKPKDGESLKINGRLDFIHMTADTRHSTNIANYICALERYVTFNNDVEFLKSQITKARRAMLFQLNALQGKGGLLDLSYFRSHSLAPNDGRDDGKNFYYGYIANNGFWDVFPTGHKNAEANYYFYMSLKSLVKLEKFLKDADVTVSEKATVVKEDLTQGLTNDDFHYYNETDSSLAVLAENVRKNICKDVKDGGFWNPATGRFAWAVYDADNYQTGTKKGDPMDYGYTELNFRMIQEGIATDEQSKSIMLWINGERKVDGDDSQGADIYFYDFAPRASTKENTFDYTSIWLATINKNPTAWAFGNNCQSGGAFLFTSYYDMMARNVYSGADDCYSRLTGVRDWYLDCYEEHKGSFGEFYFDYYNAKSTEDMMQGGDGRKYVIQSVERGKNGAIGIDSEFLESSLVYAVIPYAFFGIDASQYSNITIEPNLPSQVSYFGMCNLMFANVPYDCFITENSVEISNVEGKTVGLYLTAKFKKPKGSFQVKVGGRSTDDYVVIGDTVVIKVPFRPVKIEIV